MSEPEPKAKPAPTVRSVALLTGVVVGSAVLVGLLAIGGPLLAAGGVAAMTGAGYVRHRVKNPRRSRGWRLSWQFTGSQSRRALLPRGSRGSANAGRKASSPSGRKSPGSVGPTRKSGWAKALRSTGMGTTRSRATRSAGGVLRSHKGSRPIPASRTPKPRSAGKPGGIRAPKTPSKTPARPGSASRLTKGGSSSKGPRSTSRRSARKGFLSGLGSGSSGRGSKRKPLTQGPFSGRRTGSLLKKAKRQPAGSPKNSASRWNPFKRTSPSGLHSRTRNPFKRTTATPGRRAGRTMLNRARRLGTPGTTRRTPDRVPNRSARRPIPFRRTGARRLLRQAIGLNPAKRRRARRTLRLRGLTYLAGARKIPGRMWDARMKRVPTPIDPQWLAPTVPEPKATVQPGPRHPQPEVQRNMSVSESITDAFAQLARFEASSASEVERLIIEQPEMFATIGDHYSTLADRMVTEMPFDPAVADAVRDLGAAIAAAGQVAEQAHAVMRQAHEADFARTEQPRPGEELWDTGRQ